MIEAIDVILDGTIRKLGTIPQADGFVNEFPAYADAGHPMFTLDELRQYAGTIDTTGRSKFDSSWSKDQKSHGSCNGYAGAAALSRARVRRRLPRVDLSGAYLYSLINGGKDRGSLLNDGMNAIQQHGICTEATVGWDAIYPNRQPAGAAAEAKRFVAHECYGLHSEEELFSALMAGFDCVVAVDVDNSFMKLDGSGVAGGGRGPGNHAINLDGYKVLSDGTLAADNLGSWGVNVHDKGRCWLTWRRHFAQTVKKHGFYAIRSASDDPQGENPPDVQ